MAKYNVEEILDGIRLNDIRILQYVYKTYYSYTKYFIISNSGSDDDAKDIFQEALVVIYRKLLDEQLNISCTFKTYLYSVCRLLWLKQLEKRKVKNEFSLDRDNFIELADETKDLSVQNEKYRLYQKYFNLLGEDCRKVLEMSLEKIPLKQIAEIMGYKSEKYAKKRKYQCKERLIKEIKKDPEFKELI